jgi:hypothetical protein
MGDSRTVTLPASCKVETGKSYTVTDASGQGVTIKAGRCEHQAQLEEARALLARTLRSASVSWGEASKLEEDVKAFLTRTEAKP